MIALDEDALICDFAETYHIYDYEALPLKTAAVLAAGLRENSRIKMKLAGAKVSVKDALLASILDGVNLLVWSKTKDAGRGRNRPKSVREAMASEKKPQNTGFNTAEEFWAAWNG